MTGMVIPKLRASACRHVIGRCHVNRGQAPRPRALDIVGEIVEEHDALRRHADRLHHMIIGRRVGFPKPDRRGQEDFAEMAEHVGIGFREMLDMGPVGVGEGVERQRVGPRAPTAARCQAFRRRRSRSSLPGTGRRRCRCRATAQALKELGVARSRRARGAAGLVGRQSARRDRAGSQPACAAQHASALLKSISSTTRPRSNSSASAESGARPEIIPVVYKTGSDRGNGRPALASAAASLPFHDFGLFNAARGLGRGLCYADRRNLAQGRGNKTHENFLSAVAVIVVAGRAGLCPDDVPKYGEADKEKSPARRRRPIRRPRGPISGRWAISRNKRARTPGVVRSANAPKAWRVIRPRTPSRRPRPTAPPSNKIKRHLLTGVPGS